MRSFGGAEHDTKQIACRDCIHYVWDSNWSYPCCVNYNSRYYDMKIPSSKICDKWEENK